MHFGMWRRRAANTVMAAAVIAALAASQAPRADSEPGEKESVTRALPRAENDPAQNRATGDSPYYTDLPPLNGTEPPSVLESSAVPVIARPSSSADTSADPGASEAGIPATVLDAYKRAQAALQQAKPGCNLPWELLAAIGKVESGQARGGRVNADGTTISPILGPQLNGNGFANISDTDNGAYDGDSSYDRAVGPMQFIPSTWEWAGRDGNDDGKKDPNNIYDAALAAGHYLCRFGWDLSTQGDLDRAILSYNNSRDYLNLVMRWLEYYRKGTHEIPDGTGTLPSDRSDDTADANPTPTTPTSPAEPSKPSPPGSAKPGGDGGGSSSPEPKPPTTTPPPTAPTDTVDRLEDAGTAKLAAMAGDTFAEKISARAETKAGKAVAKVRVRFTINGPTDATFSTGEKYATALTDSAGKANAPALKAGENTGDFVVRATVVGRTVTGLDYKATVTERAADTLTRTGETALTCTPGGEFADQVEVKATYKDAVADKVAATATLIKSADDPVENDKGPYFKDADGKAVRTLTGLTTDAKGLLKLPKLYADDTTGTFLLRINTAGGATLTVELKVAAAETSPSPTPSASEPASGSASPSPSA
ncbi:lytic transglycosylase domain-containing protein [Streptomyces sp. NPDC008343]|uniref:lytic transglycosylase domain-containing protein n=1 Tax=Streptomyces sp. NPDC008343 TaxID=3364828 RepID=UPI0036E9DDC1